MTIHVAPKTIFQAISFFGKKLAIWPLRPYDASDFFEQEFWFFFCLGNDLLLLMPTAYSFFMNFDDTNIATYSLTELVSLMECVAIMIFTKCNRSRFQVLFDTLEVQLDRKKSENIKRYATRYIAGLFTILIFYFLSVGIYFIIVKARTDNERLLMTAIYPFKIESPWVRVLIYFNQVFTVGHESVVLNFDAIVFFLILMCTDNLMVLQDNVKNARNFQELKACIEQHNNILNLIKDVNSITRFMVIKTVFAFMSGVISCGLRILHSSTILQYIHQLVITILLYARVGLCAESANNMSFASEEIQNTIYESEWYYEQRAIVNAKILMIQKCQQLPVIQFNGLMSALNRKFLGTILCTTVSYFMTLKAMTTRIR